MAEQVRWGILGAGRIAGKFAEAVKESRTGRLFAIGSRAMASADAFGDTFDIPKRYGSYEELLADADVQAVYIATPHPMHPIWIIKAAEAKKHILCEKPLALNHAAAMTAIEAAYKHDVFLMEAFMYRCHPQVEKLVELIQNGVIGDVRLIKAAFSFAAGFNPDGRLFNNALGGGGILDVGCYPVSFARLVAGVALGGDVAEPVSFKAVGHIGESNVDEWTSAVCRFDGDIIAELSTGVVLSQENDAKIFGTKGWIHIPMPWQPGRGNTAPKIIVHPNGAEPETIPIDAGSGLYVYEVDTVADAIHNGIRQAAFPAMSWDDTLGNMKTLDMWRAEIGLEYDAEKSDNMTASVHGGKLRVSPDSNMIYGHVPGIDKSISRLVMGVDNQRTIAHAAAMFDDFFARGGNCFDTAYIYGGGLTETLLGQWIRMRGVRDEVVVIDKGAHTPMCYPDALKKQLMESLDRMQLDYVDIYFMHRDNPEVPVGEFIDVLNELKNAKRIGVFGGSNWSSDRVDAANQYAAEHGKTGFSAVSNNFSLARMVNPVWDGCVASSEPTMRAWHETTGMPLFPWSSQARGFFVPGRAAPDKRDDSQLVRCWYSDDNFARQARAMELAEKKGVHPIAIALAYVLNQAFPTFPLIGPRQISETRSSFTALDVTLTPDEVKWLNLET